MPIRSFKHQRVRQVRTREFLESLAEIRAKSNPSTVSGFEKIAEARIHIVKPQPAEWLKGLKMLGQIKTLDKGNPRTPLSALTLLNPEPLKTDPKALEEARQRALVTLTDAMQQERRIASTVLSKRFPERNFSPEDLSLVQELLSHASLDSAESRAAAFSLTTSGAAPAAGDIVTSAGGTGWPALASGLANFMAERSNAELALWLADELHNRICKGHAVEFFANTCHIAITGDSKPVSAWGALVANAIRADLEHLPFRLLETPSSKIWASRLEHFLQQVRRGQAPLPLLAGLGADKDLIGDCESHGKGACFLVALGALAELSGDMLAVDDAAAEAEIANQAGTLIPAVRAAKCPAPSISKICTLLNSLATDVDKVTRVLRAIRSTALAARALEAPSDGAAMFARVSALLATFVEVIDSFAELTPAADSQPWHEGRLFFLAGVDALQGKYADAVRALVTTPAIPPTWSKYLSLMVDLSCAKDATEVQALLSSAAAPAGSWRLKRQSTFKASITGIVGIGYGYERPSGGLRSYADGQTAGLLGTLGLDLSWRIGTWTLGPYLSLLDVGQLLSIPIDVSTKKQSDGSSTKAASDGESSLAQLLSPGIYLRVGAGNSPFTLGVGAAFAPALRKYQQLSASDLPTGAEQVSEFRVQAFVGIDLTLLPF